MELSTFHSMVSSALKRGTAFDADIPNYVKLGVNWLERNYTYKYMEEFRLFQVAAGDRTIRMPDNKVIKAAKFIRLIGEDGAYIYLNKVEPEDLLGLRSANTTTSDVVPSSYFIVGTDTLVLDAVPSEACNGEAIFYEYSDWPVATTSTHPLLKFASDLLLAQTLWFMAIYALKDMRMAEAYKVARDEAMSTLTRADDETKYGGESISMAFAPAGN